MEHGPRHGPKLDRFPRPGLPHSRVSSGKSSENRVGIEAAGIKLEPIVEERGLSASPTAEFQQEDVWNGNGAIKTGER